MTTRMYGFEKEVLSKYDADLLADFRSFFDTLPLAAVVQNSIFVTHGGIGPTVADMTIQELNLINRFVDPLAPGAHKALHELLWSGMIDLVSTFKLMVFITSIILFD